MCKQAAHIKRTAGLQDGAMWEEKGGPDAEGGAIALDGAGGEEIAVVAYLAVRPPGGLGPGLVSLETATSG